MATNFQSVNLTAKTFPFQQPASFNATRYGTVPWGQAIINHTFQTVAVGAGNDGLIQIDISLPSDYVAMLRNFYLGAVDTAFITWDESHFGMAYQQPGGPYKESVAAYPEDEYTYFLMSSDITLVKDRFTTGRYVRTWSLAPSLNSSAHSSAIEQRPSEIPLWIPPSADSNFIERSCILFIENQNSSQPSSQMTFRASFDLYTFEQAYSAAVMSSPRVFS